MPWTGGGTYNLPPAYSPEVNGTVIDATRYNGLTTDVAAGISNALAKDGQNVPIANLPMGGFKHINATAGVIAGDYLVFGQTFPAGSILFALGAVGAPSITFVGDTNTGVWSAGADLLSFSAGGSERMRVSAANTGVKFFGGGSSGADVATTYLLATGNKLLWVDSTRSADNREVEFTWSGGIFQGRFVNDAYLAAVNWLQVTGGQASGASQIDFLTDTSVLAMRIDASQNVGIGTTGAVGARLHVRASVAANTFFETTLARGSGANYQAWYDPTGRKGYFGYAGSSDDLYFYNELVGSISLATSNVLRATITSGGNAVFGASATATYQLNATGAGQATAAITDAGAKGAMLYLLDTAGLAGNGGGIAFGGGAKTTPFAAIKGLYTNGTNNSQGDIGFAFRAVNTDTNLTERFHMVSDGRFYGTALHNNAGAMTGTTNQYIGSGTYTPTFTNSTNVTANNPLVFQWTRVGNVVTVSGQAQVTTTAAALSRLFISLPITSAFSNGSQAAGCGGLIQGNNAMPCRAESGGTRIDVIWTCTATGVNDYSFHFTYLIV